MTLANKKHLNLQIVDLGPSTIIVLKRTLKNSQLVDTGTTIIILYYVKKKPAVKTKSLRNKYAHRLMILK